MKEECKAVFPVYLEFREEMITYINRKVGSMTVAEDLSADITLKLYRHCEKIPEIKNTRAWLYRIASNAITDYFREISKQRSVEQLLIADDSNEDYVMVSVENCLLKMLDRLPDTYRQALIMADLQGLPQKGVAQNLGISYTATKARIQRGRDKLKGLFFECCSDVLD